MRAGTLAPFPWDQAIGFGLGVLRLPPPIFWQMSVRELALAIEGVAGPRQTLISRGDLAAMMQRFPDGEGASPSTVRPAAGSPGH